MSETARQSEDMAATSAAEMEASPYKVHAIVKYPDPVLARRGDPVTEFGPELTQFVEEMWASMYAAHGIGLAAPQIGVSKRITVIDVSFKERPEDRLVLINPEIVWREGKQFEEEGCLSLPDIREKVQRAARVTVRAQDVNGEVFETDGEELLSRAMQHEIDHLDGVLFIDRLSTLKRDLVKRRIRKLQKNGEW
jgi:peptide deformylase